MNNRQNLSWIIGRVTVTRVEEAVTYVPATALMPDYEPSMLDGHRDWLVPSFFSDQDETNMALSVHAFVVESHGRTVVVDTCVGPDRPLPTHDTFLDRLDAVIDGGLAGVDVVLCTHLHFDHVGFNTRIIDGERVPTFPNARYLFGRVELEHTRTDDHMDVLAPSIEPILAAGLADLVEMDHQVTNDIRLIPTPGHSPGHVSVLIESDGDSALITGDMAHSPLQFVRPDLAAANFDHDSAGSSATRREIIDRFADSGTLVLGTHFAPPSSGHLTKIDGGARLIPDT